MGWAAVLGYTVVTLAAGRLVWWLLTYIAGDVREIARHKAQHIQRPYRPAVSVFVFAPTESAALLEECLHTIYGGSHQPAAVTVLAADSTSRLKAVRHRREHARRNLQAVLHAAPVAHVVDIREAFSQYAKSSVGVLIRADYRLDATALASGTQRFNDAQLVILQAPAVARPNNSVLRALICLRQLVIRHAKRARNKGTPRLAHGALFFRQSALAPARPMHATFAPEVHIHQETHQALRPLIHPPDSKPMAAVWAAIELSAVGIILYAYGTSRGLLMLSYAGGLVLLLIGVAVWSYKGIRWDDKTSLLLLAPFMWLGYVVWAFSSVVRRAGPKGLA